MFADCCQDQVETASVFIRPSYFGNGLMNLGIFLWSAVNRSAPAATLSNFVTGHLLGRTLKNIRYLQGCKKRLGVSNPYGSHQYDFE